MSGKKQLFISYSHNDREVCQAVAGALALLDDLELWYDKSLIPGEEYRKRIAASIQEADCFVILLSASSVRSEWVLDELEYAKGCRKTIVPVWIEPVELPPDFEMILQRYHGLFWYKRQSDAGFAADFAVITRNGKGSENWQEDAEEVRREMTQEETKRLCTLLEQAAAQQYAVCYQAENALLLGKAYYYGIRTEADFDKARFYFKVAAYHGNPDAAFFLEEMKIGKLTVQIGEAEASPLRDESLSRIGQLAEAGSVPARLFMGNVYWYGKYGYPEDMVRSAQLYESCAREGNARAQYIMASNYYRGEGVAQDSDLAVMYVHLCLETKYYKAYRRLGIFYQEGIAVPEDLEKAFECFTEGVKAGDYYCYCKLGEMYEHGVGRPVDPDKALACYLEAGKAPLDGQLYARQKSSEALGRFYENHPSIPDYLKKAAEKYLEGIQLGNADCREPYVRCRARLEAAVGEV